MAFRPRSILITSPSLPISDYGTPYMLFKSAQGREAMNELFEYTVLVRSQDEYGSGIVDNPISYDTAQSGGAPGSNFPLQSIIGQLVNIRIEQDGKIDAMDSVFGEDINRQGGGALPSAQGKGFRHINGLTTHASYVGVEGRHAMYRLTLRPWLWLLTQSSDYKVWQNMTIPQIIEEVLGTLPYPVEKRLNANYPSLDLQIQYGETHYAFIKRLMEEVGISYHFEHAEGSHTLVLSDNLGAYQKMDSVAYQELYVYPPDLKIQEEYVKQFEPIQQHTTGAVRLNDFQFKTPTADLTVTAQMPWETAHASLEKYEWHQGDYLDPQPGDVKARLRAEEFRQHGHRAIGVANVRGLQTGHTFVLRNHPAEEANRDWLVLGTEYDIEDVSQESGSNQTFSVSVRFMVQPSNEQLRPDRLLKKPHAPTQTAIVVGPEGQEVWVDKFGRIKIQFHWDRYGAKNENSSCWVRVSSPWQGTNFGGVHHPRIGQEVIIDFFHHDPDMPYISGRLTNPDHMALWELPSQYVLSGFKSKEIHGSQNNHLIMDDTPKEVQVQLTSDHGLSQLNLGYITRIPNVKGRADYRGQGFELRTDNWGAIRAAQGLLITTEARAKGQQHQKHLPETFQRLKAAQEAHEALGEVAAQFEAMDNGVDQKEVADSLKEQNDAIKGSEDAQSLPELTQPHLVMASPAGLEATTPESIHMHAGEHLAITSGSHTSMSIGKRLLVSVSDSIRMFAYKAGMKLIAAGGDIDIKALKDNINLMAKLNITQNANKIIITAKEEVQIIGGGSYSTWNAKGIEHGTNGNWIEYAASHAMPGPKSKSSQLPQKKSGKGNLELFHNYIDQANKVFDYYKAAKYELIDSLGQKKKGILDDKGHAKVSGLAAGPVKVFFKEDPRKPSEIHDAHYEFRKTNWPIKEHVRIEATNNLMFKANRSVSDIKKVISIVTKATKIVQSLGTGSSSHTFSKVLGYLQQTNSVLGTLGEINEDNQNWKVNTETLPFGRSQNTHVIY